MIKANLLCSVTGKSYPASTLSVRSEEGGLFSVDDYAKRFPWDEIGKRQSSMWRYIEALPVTEDAARHVTMGEGFSPLVVFDYAVPNFHVKLDYLMPTLSFKDRGAAMLVAIAKDLGVTHVVADSSGNAGTAIAAYAARAGITCDIYVPSATSPKKIAQIKAHGAVLHAIAGSREDTAAAAMKAVEEDDLFYASHVYNPYFYEGTKTYAFEIYEQLGFKMPDTVVVPVGNGTLLLGAYYGFKELIENGSGDKMPFFIAVQAEGCAPLYEAYKQGNAQAEPVENRGTAAEGIAIAAPARHQQILEVIEKTGGVIVTAPEEKLQGAQQQMAEKGFYAEITTAANFAGLMQYLSDTSQSIEDLGTVILPLCGAGLKSG